MRNYFIGATLALVASSAFAESLPTDTDNHLPLVAVDLESSHLPFADHASVFRLGLYQQIPLDHLMSSGMIGARHELKVSFHSDRRVIEIPDHRIRYHVFLGYDPKVDSKMPYQEVFDPDIRYQIVEGNLHLRGEGQKQCGEVTSIFSSGSYIYVEMPAGAEGVQCAIDSLLTGYGLFDFLAKDRPEMYQVVKRDTDNPDDLGTKFIHELTSSQF